MSFLINAIMLLNLLYSNYPRLVLLFQSNVKCTVITNLPLKIIPRIFKKCLAVWFTFHSLSFLHTKIATKLNLCLTLKSGAHVMVSFDERFSEISIIKILSLFHFIRTKNLKNSVHWEFLFFLFIFVWGDGSI